MLWELTLSINDPVPGFRSLVDAWKDDENKVFVLRADDQIPDLRQFLSDNFQHLGKPCPLAEDVNQGSRNDQRSGELWFEVRFDPKHPDAYRHSANAQPLHTDGSYIPSFPNATLLSCVTNAGVGGETIFVDAEDLINCLEREDPKLLQEISEYEMPHSRSGDHRIAKIIDKDGGKVRVNWNYYCIDENVDSGGRELAERFFEYHQTSLALQAKTVAVKLGPGDMVAWKDRYVLHGRNSFEAQNKSERFIWKCAIDIGNFDG